MPQANGNSGSGLSTLVLRWLPVIAVLMMAIWTRFRTEQPDVLMSRIQELQTQNLKRDYVFDDALKSLRVNGTRLLETVLDLAKIGQSQSGGINRLTYSDKDREAREVVKDWMQQIGMKVRVDPAGNIIGKYRGTQDIPAIALGSHIDTVKEAGAYDGVLGVLAALEVVRTLFLSGIHLRHPIEVIVFTDEEYSMIGSKAMAGIVNMDGAASLRNPDASCPTIQDCLASVGGDWDRLPSAASSRNKYSAFLELHVEQGPVLESMNIPVGVVQGIVHMERYLITIKGTPNHAGTTPMNMRSDALVAAAHVIASIHDVAIRPTGDQVATVGQMFVSPNVTNVVPGLVWFTADIRALRPQTVHGLVRQIEERARAIQHHSKTNISIELIHVQTGIPASTEVQAACWDACRALDVKCMAVPSRAGHDSLNIGQITDIGLIFVASRGGFSHSTLEYSSPEHITQGTDIFLQALVRLDSAYDRQPSAEHTDASAQDDEYIP